MSRAFTRTAIALAALIALGTAGPAARADETKGIVQQLAPMIGSWQCTTRTPQDDGSYVEGSATWTWWWILDGEAIMDEWRSTRPDGHEFVGINIRHVDPETGSWIVRWLPSGRLKWNEFQAVYSDGRFVMRGPYTTPSGLTGQARITFSNMTGSRFSWRMDFSPDGGTWAEGVFLIGCTKVAGVED